MDSESDRVVGAVLGGQRSCTSASSRREPTDGAAAAAATVSGARSTPCDLVARARRARAPPRPPRASSHRSVLSDRGPTRLSAGASVSTSRRFTASECLRHSRPGRRPCRSRPASQVRPAGCAARSPTCGRQPASAGCAGTAARTRRSSRTRAPPPRRRSTAPVGSSTMTATIRRGLRAGAKPMNDEKNLNFGVAAGSGSGFSRGAGLAGELVAGHRWPPGPCRPARGRPRACARPGRRCRGHARAGPASRLAGDHVRPVQHAAVGDRRVGGRHLQRRDRQALADRQVADRRARVLPRAAGTIPAASPGSPMPVRLAEAEPAHPVVEALRAELQADHHRPDVGGLGQDLRHGERARAPRSCDSLIVRSATWICGGRSSSVVGLDQPLLERARHGERP